MKGIVATGGIVLVLALAGCSKGDRELFETASFEEQQNNRQHAASLYEEIIRKYPESPLAAKAADRLVNLKKASLAGK